MVSDKTNGKKEVKVNAQQKRHEGKNEVMVNSKCATNDQQPKLRVMSKDDSVQMAVKHLQRPHVVK